MRCIGLDIETRRFNAAAGIHKRNTPFVCGAIAWPDGRTEYFKDAVKLAERATAEGDVIFTTAFDITGIERHGGKIPRERVLDPHLMGWLLDENEKIGLDALAHRYINASKIRFLEDGNEPDADDPLTKVYNERDALLYARLGPTLWPKLKEQGLDKLFLEVDMPLIWLLEDATEAGFVLDEKRLEALVQEYEATCQRTEERFSVWQGHPMKIGSPAQVWRVIFDEESPFFEDLPRQKSNGFPTTSKEAILKAPRGALRPQAQEIVIWRANKKFLSTYLKPLLMGVEPDGRRHAIFNVTRAVTGRLSSGDKKGYPIGINAQSTPKKNIRLRECFIAPPGYSVISVDADQIELRVLAHLSQDPALIEAFHSGADVHRTAAAKIFGMPFEKIEDNQRQIGKTINFSVLFGSTEWGLAYKLGIPVDVGRDYIKSWFRGFRMVRRLKDALRQKLDQDGWVRNMLGRRRRFPDFSEQNWYHQESTMRSAFSHYIQGSAADLLKEAFVKATRSGAIPSRYLFFLPVHDEFNFYAPKEEEQEAAITIKRALESNFRPMRVPIIFQSGYGSSWAEAKGGKHVEIEEDWTEED